MGKLIKVALATTLSLTTVAQFQSTQAVEDEKINYALNGIASAQKSPINYWGPDKLNDGIINRNAAKRDQSRWSSESGAPSWVMIDLTEQIGFNQINVAWENGKTRKFHIEMSDDGENWRNIYTSEDKAEGHPMDTVIDFGHTFHGRFIRLTVDALIEGAYPSVSIYEVEILGPEKTDNTDKEFRVNYALNAPDTNASAEPISYWGADKLVDGIINRGEGNKPKQSRWSSEGGAPQWASIDLGQERTFDEIMLAWEKGETVEKFKLEASHDGETWTTIHDAEAKPSGYPEDTYVYLNTPETYRYVRMTAEKLTAGTYPSVSLYEIEVIGSHKMTNLARSATATGESDDTISTVEKINDGSLETRWTSTTGKDTAKTVEFTWEQPQDIRSFIIEWDRKTAKDYVLEAEVNGEWVQLHHQDEVVKNYQQIINLDETVTTDKLRLVVNDFETKGKDRDGVIVDYPAVTVLELEIYGENYLLPPRDPATTTQDIANEVTLPEVSDDAERVDMPTVPEGYAISFLGADYEQVLTRELEIIRPLVDTQVVMNFEVVDTKTGDKAVTPDLKLTVKGRLDKETSVNEKPQVLPELQQWYGTTGEFTLTETSKIVVDPACPEFKQLAEVFKKDFEDVMDRTIEIEEGTNPSAGDFFFTKANENLEKETYYLEVEDAVTVKADEYTGGYWATRSILQILKQTEGTIAKGIAKDYPKYEVRGMMLDVARLPVEMRFLEDLVKTMSWYKMNDFQVHLNDNVFSKTNGVPDYSGFRLESEVPNLTNTDVYYTKDEFRNFINTSKSLGVNIVPEFDSPGHSGAFTRAKPEFGRNYGKDNYEAEYLDLNNKFDEIVEFMKGVFGEYTSGANPVYPDGTVVHIGTDEYKRGDKEAFRRYQDTLLRYIRDDKGYTPRVWGSQTENNGTTPITVDGVQMNLWYTGYANPEDMYNLGYDLINTNDGDLYIVPGAGYYYDYLSQSHIYGNWQPNVVGGFKIPVGDDQMLGSTFAVWNDKTGPVNDNGTSDVELFDRIFHIMPTFGSKLWGDIKDYSRDELNQLSAKTKYAPNSNPTYEVESVGDTYVDYDFNTTEGEDNSGNEYDLTEQNNVGYEEAIHHDALVLNGGESYVATPIDNVGINSTIEFWVNKDATDSDEEQILFESDFGTIKAVQKETGKFGFSRWQRDYSFNYVLPENEWVQIKLVSEFTKTKLYVNGELVDELYRDANHGNKWATMITPMERIGSTSHAFKGMIDDVVVYKTSGATDVETRWLKQEIEVAKDYLTRGGSYTEESVAALSELVNEAQLLLEKEGLEQSEADEMTAALKEAIANLVEDFDYVVTVNGEVAASGAYNTRVTVNAPVVEGQTFTGWLFNGKVISTDASYTFFLTENMELTPCYEEVKLEASALLTNSYLTKREDGKADVKFVGQLTVPEGYKVKNAGLVWSSKGAELIVDGAINPTLKPTYITKISNTNQFSVTIKGMPEGKTIRGRIFATLVSPDGNEETFIYSETEAKLVNR